MNASVDIDSLLDATLDDLEDLPEFAPYPPGAHKVIASMNLKDINGKKCVELSLRAVETVELSDATKYEPLVAGATTSLLYDLTNEFGQGAFKKISKGIAERIGSGKLRDIIEQTKEMECLVATSLRKDRNDPDRFYTNIKELAVI